MSSNTNPSDEPQPKNFLPLIDETVTNVLDEHGILKNTVNTNITQAAAETELSPNTAVAAGETEVRLMVPPNTPAMTSSSSIPGVSVSVSSLTSKSSSPVCDLDKVGILEDSVVAGSVAAHTVSGGVDRSVSISPMQDDVSALTIAKPLLLNGGKGVPKTKKSVSVMNAAAAQSQRVKLGICAMDKKARSKPMGEILGRLDQKLFDIVYFGDDMILNKPIEEWPIVDVLIAFYSGGYPLDKAEAYVARFEPFVLNDLGMQHILKDRRCVYDLMEKHGIDVPRHVYISRDGYECEGSGKGLFEQELEEYDDYITVNGITLNKPFVEKPVDADDHNICIYYPQLAGGGCKKLFRKIGDRSSEFYPEINEIRRDGSYIYEEFVETQGVDVKMYTVGPDYGHAEARKSPTVDGKVVRDSGGKEVRFPVILTQKEKLIARKIVLAFKQQVCGFDLLRMQEGDALVSYCCDVNGWSFVKNSRKYYDDCAQIITETMLAAVKPKASFGFSTLNPLLETIRHYYPETPRRIKKTKRREKILSLSRQTSDNKDKTLIKQNDNSDNNSISSKPDSRIITSLHSNTAIGDGNVTPKRETTFSSGDGTMSGYNSCDSSIVGSEDARTYADKEELRCVITVIRHGDRSPKQKLKVKVKEPILLDYFHSHTSNCRKDLKIKDRKPMKQFLEVCRNLVEEKENNPSDTSEHKELLLKFQHMRDILEKWTIGGLNRKLQLKPQDWGESLDENGKTKEKCTKLLVILKWGGNLTKLGEKQAISLGQRLRHEMYPDTTGGGILRLHSTFRHDLKIKTSDEGRVMKTAAAFSKGMLELEGDLPPILVSLVHKEKSSIHMLDPSGNKEVKKELTICKDQINELMQGDFEVEKLSAEEREQLIGPRALFSIHKAFNAVGNPRRVLIMIRETIGELIKQLEDLVRRKKILEVQLDGEGVAAKDKSEEALSGIKLYKGETLVELMERWNLLYNKLYDEETNRFDLSRVPDVHDNVRFDMLHNPHLGLTSTLTKLYEAAKLMADIVVPQEYGVTIEEKKSIGSKMCRALLEKIKYDMIIARTDNKVDMRYMINMDYAADLPINTLGRRVRTRLYFTSESHLHTLLNVLRFSDASLLSSRGKEIISMAPELCYLTQVVFRLFENTKSDIDDPRRFRVEIQFSPGATATPSHMSELERDQDSSRFDTDPLLVISRENLTAVEVENFFTKLIKVGKTDEDEEGSSAPPIPDIDPFENETNFTAPAPNLSEIIVGDTDSPVEMKGNAVDKIDDLSYSKENVGPNPLHNDSLASLDGEKFITDEAECMNHSSKTDNERNSERSSKRSNACDRKDIPNNYFWKGVAAVSLVFGFGCLAFASLIHVNRRNSIGKNWQ